MATRWFSVPEVGSGAYTDPHRPKYRDTSGISGCGAHRVQINGSWYWAVRFEGTTSALDSVESNSDATSIQESGLSKSDIASYLNNKFNKSLSFSEWEQRFTP